ncbi:hypothetical protein TNCV_2408931 [Trichonephila clavipes]|nr:hypothetical protein TNCV_2408931 [Trichonephila clavipes]
MSKEILQVFEEFTSGGFSGQGRISNPVRQLRVHGVIRTAWNCLAGLPSFSSLPPYPSTTVIPPMTEMRFIRTIPDVIRWSRYNNDDTTPVVQPSVESQIEALEIHPGKRLEVRESLTLATIQVTVRNSSAKFSKGTIDGNTPDFHFPN